MLTVFVTYRYFLGLRNLTVIRDAVDFVEQSTGEHIDIDNIDYNDPQVLAYIGTGKTDGVFQLESAGMKSFMKELRPRSLEDIIAGISLYRPGPMDFIPKYIKGKNSNDEVVYSCPQLEPILKPTYGCIVYQEQVMQIVRSLGGYTMGRSDLVRRAMSKKKQSVMEKERANFVYGNPEEGVPGCVSQGIDEKVAIGIYDEMMDFAKYAFNKSHAACYAVVTLQTAWLKYYYPVEFMAALMTSVIDNPKKLSEYILTSRSMGIELLPPDINEGQSGFAVCDGKIRYALTAIKSVGRPVIEGIVEERKRRGPFTNLNDFITRMADRELNRRSIENFIKAGAFDGLGGTRKQFMSVYVQILDHIVKDKRSNLAGQMSLFDIADESQKEEFNIRMPDVGEYSKEMMLAFEKEVLGIYLSGHPMESCQQLWQQYITNTTNDFALDEETGEVHVADQSIVTLGGMIADKTIKYTKTNQVMAFLNLEDLVGNVEIVVFPRDYEKYGSILNEEAKIFVRGRVSAEEDKDGKLICEQIVSFEEAEAAGGEPIFQPRGRRNFGGTGAGGAAAGSGYGGRNGAVSSGNVQGYGGTGAGGAAAGSGYGGRNGAVSSGNVQGYGGTGAGGAAAGSGYGGRNGAASSGNVQGYGGTGAGGAAAGSGYGGRNGAVSSGNVQGFGGTGAGGAAAGSGYGGRNGAVSSGNVQSCGGTGAGGTEARSAEKLPAGLWVQFPDAKSYFDREKELLELLANSDGNDDVVIFVKEPRGIKVLPPNRRVNADAALCRKLEGSFGAGNVKIVKTRQNANETY